MQTPYEHLAGILDANAHHATDGGMCRAAAEILTPRLTTYLLQQTDTVEADWDAAEPADLADMVFDADTATGYGAP